MVFSPCGKFLLVSGKNQREIVVIDVTTEEDTTETLVAIPLSDVVQSMIVKAKSKRIYDILCIFDMGGCVVRLNQKALDNIQTKQIDSALTFSACSFSKVHHQAVFIERCSTQLKNHYVEFEDSEGQFLSIPYKASSVEYNHNIVNSTKASEISVVGPLESGGIRKPIVEDTNGAAKRARIESNQTLEERLELLSRRVSELEERADVDADNLPSADSLVTLIDQALQTGDDPLLEQCLACGDSGTIETTAENLPSGRVLLLMRRLVAKFEKRPSRGILLTRWLSALLRHHMALLVSIPDVSAQLAGLTQMLELRLASYSRLAALGGRLDLMLAQGRPRKIDNQEASVPKTTFIDN